MGVDVKELALGYGSVSLPVALRNYVYNTSDEFGLDHFQGEQVPIFFFEVLRQLVLHGVHCICGLLILRLSNCEYFVPIYTSC